MAGSSQYISHTTPFKLWWFQKWIQYHIYNTFKLTTEIQTLKYEKSSMQTNSTFQIIWTHQVNIITSLNRQSFVPPFKICNRPMWHHSSVAKTKLVRLQLKSIQTTLQATLISQKRIQQDTKNKNTPQFTVLGSEALNHTGNTHFIKQIWQHNKSQSLLLLNSETTFTYDDITNNY
jgi:hypothetical protein